MNVQLWFTENKPLFFTICYFRVIECSDLPVTNGGCNPYAMVTLTYSKSRNKVDIKRTTVKKKTICPQYNECFHFVVNISFIYCSHVAEWLISGFGKLYTNGYFYVTINLCLFNEKTLKLASLTSAFKWYGFVLHFQTWQFGQEMFFFFFCIFNQNLLD